MRMYKKKNSMVIVFLFFVLIVDETVLSRRLRCVVMLARWQDRSVREGLLAMTGSQWRQHILYGLYTCSAASRQHLPYQHAQAYCVPPASATSKQSLNCIPRLARSQRIIQACSIAELIQLGVTLSLRPSPDTIRRSAAFFAVCSGSSEGIGRPASIYLQQSIALTYQSTTPSAASSPTRHHAAYYS